MDKVQRRPGVMEKFGETLQRQRDAKLRAKQGAAHRARRAFARAVQGRWLVRAPYSADVAAAAYSLPFPPPAAAHHHHVTTT